MNPQDLTDGGADLPAARRSEGNERGSSSTSFLARIPSDPVETVTLKTAATQVQHPVSLINEASVTELFGVTDQAEEEYRVRGVLIPRALLVLKQDEVPPEKKRPCLLCQRLSTQRGLDSEQRPRLTACEVSQHNSMDDCWIVSRGVIYDVSQFIAEDAHPGGRRAFLKRAGGRVDCGEDYDFHSARGRREWSPWRVATLVPCDAPDITEDPNSGSMLSGCVVS